jgi:hypothetical protein
MVIIGLVSNDAFNGNKAKDPTRFEHFNVNNLALYRDGESVPYSQALQADYPNKLAVQAYMRTIQSLEHFNCNISHGMTLDDFIDKGRTLYVLNLTADLNVSGECGQPWRSGNLRLELKFGAALAETINVIILGIRDGKFEVTRERQVLKSS